MTNKNIINSNKLKILINTIINRQLEQKLIKLEKRNKSEIIDIKNIYKSSNDILNKLSKLSLEVNTKIKNRKFSNNSLNKNNLKRNPFNFIKTGSKSILFNNYNNNKNHKLILRKSYTPLKNISRISKFNLKNNSIIRASSKSLDFVLKNNNNYKGNKISYKKSSKLINNNLKKKRSNEQICITPKRNKKNYFKNHYKTEEKFYKKKSKILNNVYLDSSEKDKISSKIESEKIINLEIENYQEKEEETLKKEEINDDRLSIKLGPLTETIDNEKRIYFLGHDFFKKDVIYNKSSNKSKYSYYNNSFLIIIEYIFDYLFEFLDSKSLFSLLIANKDFFKLILRLIIAKIEKKLKGINQVLSNLKEKNISLNLEGYELKSFQYNLNTIRAISLLNTITVENFFNEKKIDFNDNLINLIFDLYFISIGKKLDILTFNFDRKIKEKYIINHFKFKNKKYMGPILDYELKHIVINNEIINSLYEYSYKFINIISPNYFQKINKNIALFSFLIKNILEYIGITKDLNKKRNAYQKYKLFCSRFLINQEIIKNLKNLKDSY